MVSTDGTEVSNPVVTDINETGNTSDSESDKIQKLKEALQESNQNGETKNGETQNGESENGETKNGGVPTEEAQNGETDSVEMESEEAPVLEMQVNGECEEAATTSTPENGEVVMETDEADEKKSNGSEQPAETNGDGKEGENGKEEHDEQTNGKGVKRGAVDVIELDDDDDDDEIQEIVTPAPKKAKVEEPEATSSASETTIATKEMKKEVKEEEDTNEKAQMRLLDKLVDYVEEQRGVPASKNRKVLDTLLGAINAQVQKEPLSVRKLILDKVLVLPNTITFPPSQVCDILIEHDPEMPLTKAIGRMFGEERPKLSDSEKRERAHLKQHNPVPNMTKLLVDIGQDLVQESTYCDIVHAKNLPEVPKNLETYKQVAAQLKPVWETLKRKNEPYKLKMQRCGVCGFQTESKLVMSSHKATLHHNGNKFTCTFCKETDTSEQRMKEHYFEAHLVIATIEDKESKYPCAICEEDFNFKGVREQHYKQCKKDYIRIRNIMMPKQDDHLHINRWLWEKPPIDPSILQQQQQAALQQAQQKRQQQLLSQQQAQAAVLLRKQQLQQQQQHQRLREQAQQAQMRQMSQLLQQQKNGNTLIAAMQAQIRQANAAGQRQNTPASINMQQFQKMAAALKNNSASIQAALQAATLKNQRTPITPKMQKILGTSSTTSSPSSSSPSASATSFSCEICDSTVHEKDKYLNHLQTLHKQMQGKTLQDMAQGAPLACSRCRDRFWTYEGLERHLVMSHGLVTADLLLKAQKKEDGGRCKTCGKQYAFNMLQHLVADHQVKLCSAEIMYSCDVCAFKCSSYQTLENHLTTTHPKTGDKKAAGATTAPPAKKDDCIILDD